MPQIEHRMISNQLQSSVFLYTCQSADGMEIIKKSPSKNGSLSNGVDDLKNLTSEMEWSFLFPSYSPVFFQIGTVTYQHRLRFRWRGFMYEFLPLIRKARTRCESTVNVTQR